ncbi:unnamed protein product [Closterium sp. NIES-64]|nr:unnamed protein product [Closterium sp. NIES-64]
MADSTVNEAFDDAFRSADLPAILADGPLSPMEEAPPPSKKLCAVGPSSSKAFSGVAGLPVAKDDDPGFVQILAVIWLLGIHEPMLLNLSCHFCNICSSNHRSEDHSSFAVMRKSRVHNPFQSTVAQLQAVNGVGDGRLTGGRVARGRAAQRRRLTGGRRTGGRPTGGAGSRAGGSRSGGARAGGSRTGGARAAPAAHGQAGGARAGGSRAAPAHGRAARGWRRLTDGRRTGGRRTGGPLAAHRRRLKGGGFADVGARAARPQ